MKSNNFTYAKGIQTFLFCFGMFLLALTFTVIICFSTSYAFQSLKPGNVNAQVEQRSENGSMKNIYASVK